MKYLLLIFFFAWGCVTNEPIQLVIVKKPFADIAPEEKTIKEAKEVPPQLLSWDKMTSRERFFLSELSSYFKAKQFLDIGDVNTAKLLFEDAVVKSQGGPFEVFVFKEYLTHFASSLDLAGLSSLIGINAQDQFLKSFKKSKLFSRLVLWRIQRNEQPPHKNPFSDFDPGNAEATVSEFKIRKDFVCEGFISPQELISDLNEDQTKTWDVLTELCSDRFDQELVFIVAEDLLTNSKRENAAYAFFLLEEAVKTLRFNDKRIEAYKFYLKYFALQKNYMVGLEKKVGKSHNDKIYQEYLKLADTKSWILRYSFYGRNRTQILAHFQEYDSLLTFIGKKIPPSAIRYRELWNNLKRELIYIQAYRIFLEQEQPAKALEIVDKILYGDPYIMKLPWNLRTLWVGFLIGYSHSPTRRENEQILLVLDEIGNSNNFTKEQLEFWRVKLSNPIDQLAPQGFDLENLKTGINFINKYPLSYYSYFPMWKESQNGFGSYFAKNNLNFNRDLDLSALARLDGLYNDWKSAHLLAKMGENTLAAVQMKSIQKKLVGLGFDKQKQKEVFLYISRFYYSVQSFRDASILSQQILGQNLELWQHYPEQIFVSYPMPYLKAVHKIAEEVGVESPIIWAVMRQESVFDPMARSFAGARGLMQLVQKTALKHLKKGIEYSGEQLNQTLYNPEANIRCGAEELASLLHKYRGFLPAALAAYNAGETSVDLWLQDRYHTDPMVWIELIPFDETRTYVKKVLSNYFVYQYLDHLVRSF